MLTKWK